MSTQPLVQTGPAKLSFTFLRSGLLQCKCAYGGALTGSASPAIKRNWVGDPAEQRLQSAAAAYRRVGK